MAQRLADGTVREHRGEFAASNVLSAIGHACLRFAVQTGSIIHLEVNEAHGDRVQDPEGS